MGLQSIYVIDQYPALDNPRLLPGRGVEPLKKKKKMQGPKDKMPIKWEGIR